MSIDNRPRNPPPRHPRLRRLAIVGGALALLANAPASAAMRCGTELVVEGDSVLKLLEACGEPDMGVAALGPTNAEWIYNFGPDEFMKRVVIRDGQVERIEELGRGFVPSPTDPTDPTE